MGKHIRFIRLLTISLFIMVSTLALSAESLVYRLKINGIIDPVTADYIERGIDTGTRAGANVIIIEIDTPGGLDSSMRRITRSMMNSSIPVVTFVSPRGARAASAGMFISLAAHRSAMAPGTNIGAAHPVYTSGESASDKVTADAAAYAKSLAQQRNRNPEWVELSVTRSSSFTNEEALNNKMIDLIADNIDDLLKKLDGTVIPMSRGDVIIKTDGAKVFDIDMSLRESIFHLISNPDIAYILLMMAIIGIAIELATPGIGFSGAAGGVCFLLWLVAFEALPFNIAGLILILAGMILFIVEAKTPTHGTLTAGGALCLIVGSFMLYSPIEPYINIRVSWPIIIVMTLLMTGLFALVVKKAMEAMRKPAAFGTHLLINAVGVAKTNIDPKGVVNVQAEEWNAISVHGDFIPAGSNVRVTKIDGFTVYIEKV